jgi:S1-C subfamily serine protease
MKKELLILVMAFLILPFVPFAQRIVELPYVEINSHVQSLLIKSIELTDEYTVVNVRYVNALGESWILTHKPGDEGAFYIADQYGKRIAELINVKNLPYAPNKRTLSAYDEIVDFTLIFGAIDKNLKKIDIIEGNSNDQSNFNFYGVYIDGTVAKGEEPKNIIKPDKKTLVSSGTGFLISTDGYIATNFHVIDESSELEVVFPSENGFVTYKATVYLNDKTNDISILRINDDNFEKLNYLPYELSEKYEVGDEVFTIGYPHPDIMGTESKLTTGIINSLSGFDNDNTCVQISVPVQPGNSGGPLFNSKGNIVGITTSTLNSIFMAKYKGNIPQNVNYAVKTEYLKVLTKSLHLDGKNIVKEMILKDKVKELKSFVCLIKVY